MPTNEPHLPVSRDGRLAVRIYKAPGHGNLFNGRFLDGHRAGESLRDHQDVLGYMVKAWGGWLVPDEARLASGRDPGENLRVDSWLESLWRVVETGGPRAEAIGIPRLVDNPAAITSFLVGDVVELGTPETGMQFWMVAGAGWVHIETLAPRVVPA